MVGQIISALQTYFAQPCDSPYSVQPRRNSVVLYDKGSISLALLCLLTMVTKYLASEGGFLAHKLKGDSLS